MYVHVPYPRGELPLLDVWKNALKLFVWNKHFINKKHEFAIVILNEKAQWVSKWFGKGSLKHCTQSISLSVLSSTNVVCY